MGQLWDIVQAHIDSAPYPPSERQVAARLGISPTALAKWREPKRLPDVENLRSLARLAGVPYRSVLGAALADTGYEEREQDQTDYSLAARAGTSRKAQERAAWDDDVETGGGA
ncbi:helix-turn-helix protein [Sediminihabitans luteus]|uniref:Helix-turn-helix protein n=2 Tax=Sediminihabitans luteus TaxID=1138585 RepID=A0A2M9CZU2_9CELL|nr:helix-turn-helix protein [Sediminihabitans luteus]GII98355.1 hypothetical protein Slu03_07330 [Sediminihabitans luteus]